MQLAQILGYEFVQNALIAAVLASLLCGLVGTFVVVKRLVFISGGVSHAAFGGLGICHFLGLPPLLGAGAGAIVAALLVSRGDRQGGRTRDAVIGILWAVGMAVGVVFIARTPGYAPNLTTYLFGDILAVSRPLLVATAVLVAVVLACVTMFFKELVAVSFDEEYARSQGLPVRRLLTLLMVLIALSVVLLIQAVGVILAIALLTIPPTISLTRARSFRGVIVQATLLGLLMTLGGLAASFAWDLPTGPAVVLLGFLMLLVTNGWQRLRSRATISCLAALTCLGLATLACSPQPPPPTDTYVAGPRSVTYRHLELLGQATIPAAVYQGVPLGGLSGLTYDREKEIFYAISDDRAERGPARFYSLRIDLADTVLDHDDVRVLNWTPLTGPDGEPFEAGRIDPEAIALTPDGSLIVSSEGDARQGLAPFLRAFTLDGRQVEDYPLGERYAPRRDGRSGVRNNLAMESAGLTPDGSVLFTVTENALAQDGPLSTVEAPSPGRIIEYDISRRQPVAEYLYWIDRVAEPPVDGGFNTAGAVEILALDRTSLLILERSFSVGAGNDIRIYEVDLSGATNILNVASLIGHGFDDIVPAAKRLLIHIDGVGIESDNLEGMTFGPRLPDGSPTLILIADDNFNRPLQSSQVLAFALRAAPVRIPAIQGAAHRSPYEGDWIRGVEGVVTAVDPHPRFGGFWLAGDADGDPTTSDALFVLHPGTSVERRDRVRVDGGVREIGRAGSLTTTRLDAGVVEILGSDAPLPAPVEIGVAGRQVPDAAIDDDAMQQFEPCCDTIDFFESLEGMRISVDGAVATSGTSRYGEVVVAPDNGAQLSLRSAQGGAVLQPADSNPELIVVDDRLAGDPPSVAVGDQFRQPLTGVLDYSFGNFKLLVEEWPSTLREQRFSPAARSPEPPLEVLTVASYNVLNLDAQDDAEQFQRLGRSIVDDLGSPDLIGLQEIQDDNGGEDGGVVSAAQTMGKLIDTIELAGGPRYDYRQIDPRHNADGGQPNGNIRVVWMFDPLRVDWLDRGASEADDGVTVLRAADGSAELSASPARLAPTDPAFAGDEQRGWEGGRKCLAGEIAFADQHLFLLNCHLKSKRGDEPLFGAIQPPSRHSESQRLAQAVAVSTFVQEILDIEPGAQVVVLGDMNEHEFREPIRRLVGETLVNLADLAPAAERYSYNYNGNSQVLDHILVSRSLADRSPELRYVHINADAAHDRRASDHDPVLAWLRF